MRSEIYPSNANNASQTQCVWRVWDKGQLVARGQSPNAEEAREAVRAVMGERSSRSGRRTGNADNAS